MKKISLLFLSLIGCVIVFAQTAPNYIGNDCSGAPHDLYTEMDAGKVLVVCFVAPSPSSVGPALAAQSTVQDYSSSHPGRVLFYVADDNGDTPCATLNTWASGNGINRATLFSNPGFKQSDYPGSAIANPKTVVIGGLNHHIYYQEDFTINTLGMQTGINAALATTGLLQYTKNALSLNIFPNPVTDNISISYSLETFSDISIDIYTPVGIKILSLVKKNQSAGPGTEIFDLDRSLSNGVYFATIKTHNAQATMKFIVER